MYSKIIVFLLLIIIKNTFKRRENNYKFLKFISEFINYKSNDTEIIAFEKNNSALIILKRSSNKKIKGKI